MSYHDRVMPNLSFSTSTHCRWSKLLRHPSAFKWPACYLRSLAINALKRFWSSLFIANNFNPSPPDFTCRTTASAPIRPSWTRKSTLTDTPTVVDFAVSTNRPPRLKSRTRDVSSRPLKFQQTQTSTRVSTREKNLRGYEGFCCKFKLTQHHTATLRTRSKASGNKNIFNPVNSRILHGEFPRVSAGGGESLVSRIRRGLQLAVDNSVDRKFVERLRDLRESFVEVLVVTRVQNYFAADFDADGAVAIQLNFVSPIGALGQ